MGYFSPEYLEKSGEKEIVETDSWLIQIRKEGVKAMV